MIVIKLFLEFIKIGAFSFGGGLGTLPYIYELANKTLWITEENINTMLTISQVTPGPLACNIGTIVGFNVSGIIGSLFANLGFIFPAICFMGVGYKIIEKIKKNERANEVMKIVRSSALAVLIGSCLTLFKKAFLIESEFLNINFKSLILGVGIYFLIKNKKIKSIYIMLFSAIIAVIFNI